MGQVGNRHVTSLVQVSDLLLKLVKQLPTPSASKALESIVAAWISVDDRW